MKIPTATVWCDEDFTRHKIGVEKSETACGVTIPEQTSVIHSSDDGLTHHILVTSPVRVGGTMCAECEAIDGYPALDRA